MRALVVYESMFGNTHVVAEEIAEGIGADLHGADDIRVIPVGEADAAALAGVDLVVVGGPTHAHGMVRESTREAAIAQAAEPDSELHVDPDAEGPILREWFDGIDGTGIKAAAFDTRVGMPTALTGRASKGISHRLHHQGFEVVAKPVSFFVDKGNHLEPGAVELAREWGRELAQALNAHPLV